MCMHACNLTNLICSAEIFGFISFSEQIFCCFCFREFRRICYYHNFKTACRPILTPPLAFTVKTVDYCNSLFHIFSISRIKRIQQIHVVIKASKL